jgi:hypothetical protein
MHAWIQTDEELEALPTPASGDDMSMHLLTVVGEPQFRMIQQVLEGMTAVGVVSPHQAVSQSQGWRRYRVSAMRELMM